jgi:type IV pilus assembly protein PilW
MVGMLRKRSGFTLVEILVALALAGIVSAAVYNVYISQNKSYVVQDRVAEMQQNLRAAMYMMKREIRMAGYDPSGSVDAGFVTGLGDAADPDWEDEAKKATTDDDNTDDLRTRAIDRVAFTIDDDGDGTIEDANEERVAYRLGGDEEDELQRLSAGAKEWHTLAQDIDAVDFVYLGAGGPTDVLDLSVDDLASIRSVQITLVARANFRDQDYTNNTVYVNQQGDTILDMSADPDNFRRRRLTTQVRCRNLGL